MPRETFALLRRFEPPGEVLERQPAFARGVTQLQHTALALRIGSKYRRSIAALVSNLIVGEESSRRAA
jgi:hypothetical protein